MVTVTLRPVTDDDLPLIFEQMRDPASVRMAAFTAADPDDRAAFEAHMARVRSAPDTTLLAVIADGVPVGTVGAFVVDGDTEVTYWIDRAHWGRGIASRALALLLTEITVRPVFARAASDNAGSLRVLAKAGFEVVGTERAYAPGRGAEIDETVLRLGGPGARR
jgi:RimJ/RimL family protein N-acetyltransferase